MKLSEDLFLEYEGRFPYIYDYYGKSIICRYGCFHIIKSGKLVGHLCVYSSPQHPKKRLPWKFKWVLFKLLKIRGVPSNRNRKYVKSYVDKNKIVKKVIKFANNDQPMTPKEFNQTRKELGLSIFDLAYIMDVKYPTVSGWGTRVEPPLFACRILRWMKSGKLKLNKEEDL